MLKNEPTELKKSQEKFYGIYRGVVEDNNDSEEWSDRNWEGGTGRVRVRIWGIHTKKVQKNDKEGIPVSELPWAEPAYPIFEGSISGVGMWSVPVQGTHVFVFFENGDPMEPRYFACAPGIQPKTMPIFDTKEGFYDPNKNRPLPDGVCSAFPAEGDKVNDNDVISYGDINEPDMCEEARNYYPFNSVIKTRGNILIELDSTKDARRYHVKHPVGADYLMDENGNVSESTAPTIGNITEWAYSNYSETASRGSISEEAYMAITNNSGMWSAYTSDGPICINGTIVLIGDLVYLGVPCDGSGEAVIPQDSSLKSLANSEHTHTCPSCGLETSTPNNGLTANTFAI